MTRAHIVYTTRTQRNEDLFLRKFGRQSGADCFSFLDSYLESCLLFRFFLILSFFAHLFDALAYRDVTLSNGKRIGSSFLTRDSRCQSKENTRGSLRIFFHVLNGTLPCIKVS